MATTTPNFGWAVPTSTDLVKDGAVAIETLGDSIDASLVDLKGGTTGQVLKKATNTDMDFVWSADSAGMTNPMTTTGDTIYSSSGSTPARLGIGTTGQVLTVSGGIPAWATASSGAVVQVKSATTSTQVTTTGSTMIDTGLSVSITPTSASNKILVFVTQQMAAESAASAPEPSTFLELFRNSTSIWNGGGQYGFYFFKNASGTTDVRIIVNATYLDSPATTSAITYKTQFARGAANVTAKVQAQSSTSTITVMEVTP